MILIEPPSFGLGRHDLPSIMSRNNSRIHRDKKEAQLKYYTKQHQYTCGIDLHAKILYVCILDSSGNILVHRKCKANPETLLKLIEPYLEDLLIGVECMFTWYWIADFCEQHNIHFALGHAQYMKAIHGGKAKNDKIDSEKIARLLHSKMFPKAFVYPAKLRGTRDLVRRRNSLMRERAQLMSHIQNTAYQYNLFIKLGDLKVPMHREGIAELFEDKSVQLSMQLDLDRIEFYTDKLNKLEWYLKKTARHVDAQTISILQSIHGVGTILSLVMLYEIHSVDRFDSVQDFASYSRLIKCRRESAGKLYGTGGAKIGNPSLRWAFGEAATLFLRANPDAQKWLEKKAQKHGKPKALTLLAHKLGRAVYFMLKRKQFFDQERFLATS